MDEPAAAHLTPQHPARHHRGLGGGGGRVKEATMAATRAPAPYLSEKRPPDAPQDG